MVDRADSDVVPELGVPLFCDCQLSSVSLSLSLVFRPVYDVWYLRAHVRRRHGLGGGRRQVDQRRSCHCAFDGLWTVSTVLEKTALRRESMVKVEIVAIEYPGGVLDSRCESRSQSESQSVAVSCSRGVKHRVNRAAESR